MNRLACLFAAQMRRSAQQFLTWWGFLLTLVISQLVAPLISYAVWHVALPGNSINAYFIALLVVKLFTCSYEAHTTSAAIYNGDVIDSILRPCPLALEAFAGTTAMRLLHIAFSAPLIAALVIWIQPRFSPLAWLGVPATLGAMALRFCYTYTLALCAFFSQRALGIVGFGELFITALGGEAVPLALSGFMNLAQWLPFRYMLGFPAELASGSLTMEEAGFGFLMLGLWGVLLYGTMRLTMLKGLRAYKGVEN